VLDKKFYLREGKEVEHSLGFGVDKKIILKVDFRKWVRECEHECTGRG